MNKILFLGILILFGLVFLYLMFNPPRAKKYNLKRLNLSDDNNLNSEILGKELFVAKSNRKFILPTEFDLWTEIVLFEHCIVFKRNNKEKKLYFSEINEIEPMLILLPFHHAQCINPRWNISATFATIRAIAIRTILASFLPGCFIFP